MIKQVVEKAAAEEQGREKNRLDAERREREEKQRHEFETSEAQRRENERLANERGEKDRSEAERLDAERRRRLEALAQAREAPNQPAPLQPSFIENWKNLRRKSMGLHVISVLALRARAAFISAKAFYSEPLIALCWNTFIVLCFLYSSLLVVLMIRARWRNGLEPKKYKSEKGP